MTALATKPLILVVDDAPAGLGVLFELLNTAGYDVLVAEDCGRALEQAAQEQPDLIILDILMPDVDGFEVFHRLNANPRTRNIPVIFVTALHTRQHLLKAFRLGGVDYITKPIQGDEVLARVRVHLQIWQLRRQLETQNEVLQGEIEERQRAEASLAEAMTQLELLVMFDALTEVGNRRRFDACLHQEWSRLAREGQSLALIMCDLDDFKRFNDTWGHLTGDQCLREVAQTISQSLRRPADLVARYGGEEFAVILPSTNVSGAIAVAERVRASVGSLAIPIIQSRGVGQATISLGIASVRPNVDSTAEALVHRADLALYEAKRLGGNRWCVEGGVDPIS